MGSKKKYFYDPEDGIALARSPGFAYHCDTRMSLRGMLNTYDFYELCNFVEINLINLPIFSYTTKHNPLTEFFKIL